MLIKFYQVKLSSIRITSITKLFKIFKLNQALKSGKITKTKGHSVIEMLWMILLMILQSDKSLYHGLSTLFMSPVRKAPLHFKSYDI